MYAYKSSTLLDSFVAIAHSSSGSLNAGNRFFAIVCKGFHPTWRECYSSYAAIPSLIIRFTPR